MTAAAGFSGLALVSSAICFSGASSGDFIGAYRKTTFQAVMAGRLPSLPGFNNVKIDRPGGVSAMTSEDACLPVSLFIKSGSIAGVLFQYFARQKFLLSLRQPFQFIDDFLQPKMFREPQWSTSERCETGSQNHSVVRVLGGVDNILLHTARSFIDHQEDQSVGQFLFI